MFILVGKTLSTLMINNYPKQKLCKKQLKKLNSNYDLFGNIIKYNLNTTIIHVEYLYVIMAAKFLQKIITLKIHLKEKKKCLPIFQQRAIYEMECYKENLSFNLKSPNFKKFNISSIRGGSDGTPRSSQSIFYISIKIIYFNFICFNFIQYIFC
jgi:hypothetical protein